MRQQIAFVNEEKNIGLLKIEMLVQENEGLKVMVNQLSCIKEELIQKNSLGWYHFKNNNFKQIISFSFCLKSYNVFGNF